MIHIESVASHSSPRKKHTAGNWIPISCLISIVFRLLDIASSTSSRIDYESQYQSSESVSGGFESPLSDKSWSKEFDESRQSTLKSRRGNSLKSPVREEHEAEINDEFARMTPQTNSPNGQKGWWTYCFSRMTKIITLSRLAIYYISAEQKSYYGEVHHKLQCNPYLSFLIYSVLAIVVLTLERQYIVKH